MNTLTLQDSIHDEMYVVFAVRYSNVTTLSGVFVEYDPDCIGVQSKPSLSDKESH